MSDRVVIDRPSMTKKSVDCTVTGTRRASLKPGIVVNMTIRGTVALYATFSTGCTECAVRFTPPMTYNVIESGRDLLVHTFASVAPLLEGLQAILDNQGQLEIICNDHEPSVEQPEVLEVDVCFIFDDKPYRGRLTPEEAREILDFT